MLSNRLCYDCGRQVRLSTTIQPPRCPACRLSRFSPLLETRPCLNCHVPIPIHSSNMRCASCEVSPSLNPSYSPCYDCRNPFPVRAGVIRCFDCRSRKLTVVQPPVDFRHLPASSFDPYVNTFERPNPLQNPTRRKRRQSQPPPPPRPTPRPQTIESDSMSFAINRGVDFLRKENELRVLASNIFPSAVSSSDIRLSVARFENEMALATGDTTCSSCGKIVPSTDIRRFIDGDPLLRALEGLLDSCGCNDGFWNLCSVCHAALLRGSTPKFSAKNNINVTLCQHYPEALKDLTLTEEYLIAKSHPVGVVVKLRPGGQTSPANYRALRGHFIVIPQDPKPLLEILPSPELQFTELIKVFWLGKRPPTDADLQPFLTVRKCKVLAALRYLVRHNPLYGDVTIDHSAVDNWPDDFIPSDLQQQVICLGDTDHHERGGYSVNLQEGNYENDWQAAEDNHNHFTDDSLPITASVITDLNGDRQNPDLRLLNTVYNLHNDPLPEVQQYTSTGRANHTLPLYTSPQRAPVVEYGIRGQALLLNQWQDLHFLTSAFPTLFPVGIGGHLDDRIIPVSLVAFANWALRHHSRRQVLLQPAAQNIG